MSDPINRDRATRGLILLRKHEEVMGYGDDQDDPDAGRLGSALTDLMHYAREAQIDWETAMIAAVINYEQEIVDGQD